MSQKTFDLLKSLDGKFASVNGITQIRAGVIRPELIVAQPEDNDQKKVVAEDDFELRIGSRIRMITSPNFGKIGTVVELPNTPELLPSGATVRVLRARLEDGTVITVPRTNVEL